MHADKIKTPLFVAQGAHDPRVNKAESDQMVAALKKRGVDVEYMVKENEGHGFHNEENRFDFYGAMEKFLDDHLHPETANGVERRCIGLALTASRSTLVIPASARDLTNNYTRSN